MEVIIGLFLIVAVAIGYLYYLQKDADHKKWQKKIDRYTEIADSLGRVMIELDRTAYKKDSIILSYMESVRQSVYQLDKEAAKDKRTIDENVRKQADLLKDFCDRIETSHKPDFCK
jgi:hypothetical protein